MHKDEEICHRIFDEGHPSHRCSDYEFLFLFNEIIIHAFARHIKAITIELKIHQQIALTYHNQPMKYYWQEQDKKELIKILYVKE